MSPLRKAIALACVVALAIVAGAVLRGSIGSRTEPSRHEAAPETPETPLPEHEAIVDRPGAPYDVGRWFNSHDVGEVSPGSRGSGTSTLRLTLVSADDGSPVAMPVRLWRLGVEADDDWTEGDHIQARDDVAPEGVTFDGLPAGRYRVECLDARRGAPDPAEFEVRAGANERRLHVQPRRPIQSRLRIYGEDGRLVSRVVRDEISSWRDGRSCARWIRPRVPVSRYLRFLDGPLSAEDIEELGFPFAPSYPLDFHSAGEIEAGPRGFDLGVYRERGDGHWRDETRAGFQVAGCNTVVVVMRDDEVVAGATYVGVSVPFATLTDNVLCSDPNWTDGATITSVCRSHRFDGDPPPDAWRSVPVHVSIRHHDFFPIEFDWTANASTKPDYSLRLVYRPER